jgi:acetyl-CoA acyltransferase 2
VNIQVEEFFLCCLAELLVSTPMHFSYVAFFAPLCFPGSRIVAHLANEFHQPGNTAKIHVGSACIGGGQGIAVILEKA